MSEHITGDEMKRYFDIICAGTAQAADADFVEEVDAHVAECDGCFEKMRAARLLLQGFSSGRDLAEAFLRAEFPEPFNRPAFDIRRAFGGIKLAKAELAGKLQMLADTLSPRMDARFFPCTPALAAVRGAGDGGGEGALNDLLRSEMALPLAEGRRITLRCREAGASGSVRLFVYSNFDAEFTLYADGGILQPERSGYDRAAGEYVCVYGLDGSEFTLTAG